mgnify:CR=1 FL=1
MIPGIVINFIGTFLITTIIYLILKKEFKNNEFEEDEENEEDVN